MHIVSLWIIVLVLIEIDIFMSTVVYRKMCYVIVCCCSIDNHFLVDNVCNNKISCDSNHAGNSPSNRCCMQYLIIALFNYIDSLTD